MKNIFNIGRFLFGIPFIIFGIQHFIYADFAAGLVPAWIPWHKFWIYFVGIAMIAAGISILINVKARLAAFLIGSMILLFILLIHLPWLADDLHNGSKWANAMKDMAISGGAFILAGSLAKK